MRYLLTSYLCVFLGCLSGQYVIQEDYVFLDRLALEAGTDKSSNGHNYTEIYAQYFAPIRDQPHRFLEIGISLGNSVKLWEQYFPNAKLFFIDKDSNQIQYHSKRSQYHFLDQADAKALQAFAQKVGGGFDIIIDDGGHTMDQQITSFKTLFPYLSPGGLYIIEDLHTSYWKEYGGKGSRDAPQAGPGTAIQFLKNLVDDVNYTGATTKCADLQKIPEEIWKKMNGYQKKIYTIHFYGSVCIIIKRKI